MKERQRIFKILIILLICACFLTQTGIVVGADTVSQIKLIMDDNYPPYVFRDNNGKLQGILIDQWKLWEDKTGIAVEIEASDWDSAVQAMLNGEYDVIDTIFKNPERERYLAFGKPYTDIKVCIFFNKNISGITGISSLHGFNVGVKRSDNVVSQLRANGIYTYTEFDSYESIIAAAKECKIHVFIMDEPPALHYIYKMDMHHEFKSSDPIAVGQLHRAVQKENLALINIIQTGFDSISRDELSKIETKWLGQSLPRYAILRYLSLGLFAVLLILYLMFLWNIMLRKMVRQKTGQLESLLDTVKESEDSLRKMIMASPDLVFVLNKNGMFLECYARNHLQLLFSTENVLERYIFDVLPEEYAARLAKGIEEVIGTREMKIIEYTMETEGEEKSYETRLVLRSENIIMCITRDITDQKQWEKKLSELSTKDSLTGLYNRFYFEQELEQFKWNEASNVALIVCDLNGLKIINDTLGHDRGDECLKLAADILRKSFRDGDLTARIGGDEFAVIMKDSAIEEIEAIMVNIEQELDDFRAVNPALPLSMSLGYAITDDPGKSLQNLLKEADDSMYRNKLKQKPSSKNNIIDILLKMLVTRDFITEGHGERIQDLVEKLAKRISLNSEEIEKLRLFALFHDVGKVGISEKILFKPDKLTPLEYDEIKRHVEIGFRIAKSTPDLIPIADWIYMHHEWWNGEGYPFQLKGHAIPVQCRILAIVDAYDAMTSDRPYRKAISGESAIEELRRCSGTQFDPVLVELFIELIVV